MSACKMCMFKGDSSSSITRFSVAGLSRTSPMTVFFGSLDIWRRNSHCYTRFSTISTRFDTVLTPRPREAPVIKYEGIEKGADIEIDASMGRNERVQQEKRRWEHFSGWNHSVVAYVFRISWLLYADESISTPRERVVLTASGYSPLAAKRAVEQARILDPDAGGNDTTWYQ